MKFSTRLSQRKNSSTLFQKNVATEFSHLLSDFSQLGRNGTKEILKQTTSAYNFIKKQNQCYGLAVKAI